MVKLVIDRFTPYDQLPEWLTIEEFRAFWDVGRSAAYDGIRRGDIPHQRFGNLIRIPRSAVRAPEAS